MYIASVFSQLERETIAERIRDNMRELSKTGRWLGGTAPMGYRSETVASVSVDGKTRKACKLTPIPEDIALVKLIYDKFLETGSLTAVDQFLLEKRYTTKRGNRFTRFAIRGILTNPVYMIADAAAFDYLAAGEAEVFAEREDFDGTSGVMAYNRTLQQPGKAHKERPMNEWVIAVGKHPGVIPGETWVQVQNMLEVNRSKSYRRPRSHTALLSGLLVCKACGDYMRPKLTGRTNAAGEPIYTYLCSSKERSKGTCCSMKNANGNMLDAMVIEEIKKLPEDASLLAKLLSETGSSFIDNRTVFSTQLASLQEKLAENDAGIRSLVLSLAKAAGTAAEEYILAQIEELHRDSAALKTQIDELSKLTEQNPPVEDALALLRSMIASVGACIDECTVEEKRRYLRTIIQKIEWDGENAAVYLFAGEGELDLASGEPSCEDSE